jgi:preprotein translocase subunit SecA
MPMLSRQLDAAQRRSEENNYSIRKFTLEYDDVVNQQRQLIYKEREEILHGADVHEQVVKYISVLAEKVVYDNIPFAEITDETDVDYVKINSRILGTLLHHMPTEEEKELAIKYIHDTLALSAYILDENVKENEKTLEATTSLSEVSDSLAVDDEEDEVLYQEMVTDKGQIIRVDVSKFFINPKVIQKRSADFIVDYAAAVATLQYCSRIREYNALMYKEIQQKDVEYMVDKSQKVIKGSDYEQAIAAFKATLEADRERWVTSKEIEQHVLLTIVNKYWMDHIDNMDTLKRGIVLRGYGQRNPLVEYRLESSNLFDDMVFNIQIDTAYTLLKHNKIDEFLDEEATRIDRVLKGFTFVKDEQNQKPGRNSPCPCGSGRKYKNCCGRNA